MKNLLKNQILFLFGGLAWGAFAQEGPLDAWARPQVVSPAPHDGQETPPSPAIKKLFNKSESAEPGDLDLEAEDREFHRRFGFRRGFSRFQFGMGYVFSEWSRMSSDLKNGSLALTIGAARRYGQSWEGGLNFLILNGSDNTRNQENIYLFSANVEARWFFFSARIKPFAGLGLGFGSYRAWSLRSETPSSIIYAKHAGGYTFNTTPSLGFRIQAFPWMGIEVLTNYPVFLSGGAARHLGGLGVLTQLSFTRYAGY